MGNGQVCISAKKKLLKVHAGEFVYYYGLCCITLFLLITAIKIIILAVVAGQRFVNGNSTFKRIL